MSTRGRKLVDRIRWLGGLLVLLFLWHIVSSLTLVKHLPTPVQTISVLYSRAPELLVHVLATLGRAFAGFAIGAVAGIMVALLIAWNRFIEAAISPLALTARNIPVMSLIPVFILWFGLKETARVLFIALGVFFVLLIVAVEAIRNVPPIHIRAARTLGATEGQIYRSVVLPSILPGLIGGLRIAGSGSFPLAIAAEYMGAPRGVGYLLIKEQIVMDLAGMIAGAISIVIVATVIDLILAQIRPLFLRYL